MAKCCEGCSCKNRLCIGNVPIFSSLHIDDLSKISELINHNEYKKGETIIREGETIHSIMIIHEGNAKACKYTTDGREQILYVFSEGDFLAEQSLLSNYVASYTVEALQDIKTCSLSKESFQTLLYRHPEIAVKIIEELGERMTRLENTVQSMGVRNIDSRIGGLLIEYAVKFGTEVSEGTLIKLPLSREGIANSIGIARETLSRKFSQLENEGIIQSQSNKIILLKDTEKLKISFGV